MTTARASDIFISQAWLGASFKHWILYAYVVQVHAWQVQNFENCKKLHLIGRGKKIKFPPVHIPSKNGPGAHRHKGG